MSLVVVGLNHRTVPVELLERMAVAPAGMPKALQDLARREHLAEVVLLSTCNRTEIYSHATLFHPAMQDVRDFLADTSGVDPDEFGDLLYAYHDDAAVAHLFGVAAGLDSMIIGEGEILGQVREAWTIAEHEHASGPLLSRTFRHAIEVGKRARTETGIGRNSVSVSTAAVTLAASKLGTLDERRVLVLGAGEMGESAALALGRRGRRRDRRRQPHRVDRGGARGARRTAARSRWRRSPTRSTSATCSSCRPARPTCWSSGAPSKRRWSDATGGRC